MRQFLHCDGGYKECERWESGCWVNMECPGEADINFLVDELGVPRAFLDDLTDIDERPRVDQEGMWKLTILRIPVPQDDDTAPYATVPLGIFTSDIALVTVCFFKTALIKDFIEYSGRKQMSVSRPADFIIHILFSSTYWFLNYLKRINELVAEAEHALEQSVQNRDVMSLMRLQKSLVLFNTSLRGNEVLLERLYHSFGDDFDHELLEDLEIELKQADNTVAVYSDILQSTMDAYSSIISNNVNQIMKRMTGITIILMVPTLVASFYGMNVGGLAFADLPLSFYLVIFIAAVFTVLTYLWLRHIRWF